MPLQRKLNRIRRVRAALTVPRQNTVTLDSNRQCPAADEMPMAEPIQSDQFFQALFARVPRDVAETFSGEQMLAIKAAFGGQEWDLHPVDVRRSITVFGKRVYLTLLAGTEGREPMRRFNEYRPHGFWHVANATGYVLVGAALVASVLGLLYLGGPTAESSGIRDRLSATISGVLD